MFNLYVHRIGTLHFAFVVRRFRRHDVQRGGITNDLDGRQLLWCGDLQMTQVRGQGRAEISNEVHCRTSLPV